MNPLKISIPKPCHESWDAMTPESQGRFCALCEKTVVDFTGMKAQEISDYFLANISKKVCGRFETAQLQEAQPIISPKLLNKITRRPLSFRQMFIVALMACMGSTLFSCNNVKGEPAMDNSDTISQQDTIRKSYPEHTTGVVIYSEDNPAPDVKFKPLESKKTADTLENKNTGH